MIVAEVIGEGMCVLTDVSKPGDWRLSTKDELLNRQKNLQGFTQVADRFYWTSTHGYCNSANMRRLYAWAINTPPQKKMSNSGGR